MAETEPRYRYPGLVPFGSDQKDLFFGREVEKERLAKAVLTHQQVLLYAKSGLGKSSLINAGLIPRLRENPNSVVLPIRIGAYLNANSASPVEVVANALQDVGETILDRIIPQEGSLWYHFKAHSLSQKGIPTYYLIFDQFEELFSHPEEQLFAFKKQLADLLYRTVPQQFSTILRIRQALARDLLSVDEWEQLFTPIDTKVLYAIREDRYHEVNRLTDYLPDIVHNRIQLAPLSRRRAEEAIVKPAELGGSFATKPFNYTFQALADILDFLGCWHGQPIEATQLQVLCSHIEKLEKRIVNSEDIPAFDDIFLRFYLDSIAALHPADQARAREFIENHLIIGVQRIGHHRLACLEYISQRALDTLLRERHLLRAEHNSTGETLELSHDTLVVPILMAKELRETDERKLEEVSKRVEEERKRRLEEESRIAEELKLRIQLVREQQLRRTQFLLAVAIISTLIAFLFIVESRRQRDTAENRRIESDSLKAQAIKDKEKVEEALGQLRDAQVDQLLEKYEWVEKLDFDASRYLIDSMWRIDSTNLEVRELHQKYWHK